MADAIDIDNEDKGTYLTTGALYKLEADQNCVIQNCKGYGLHYQFDDVDQKGWHILDTYESLVVPTDKTVYFKSISGIGKITRTNV
jgi:hypothetical protein